MRSIATGIDLVEIERFQTLDPKIRERFYKRVFTPSELTAASGLLQNLAGKFAAKEATAKALGCGIGEIKWQDIEILNDENGKPTLVLHDKALDNAQNAFWSDCSISISHTTAYAVAIVTAIIETPDR
ncbi:MAG: holo-[acyl-carrier-protein] synthase [Anaerolinea sp.]|nr:holo-[acyl-carrier-protein] synthase [Anaerolinea sp.]